MRSTHDAGSYHSFFLVLDQIRRNLSLVLIFGNDRVNNRQTQGMLFCDVRNFLALCINGVPPVFLIPFRQACSLMHILDNLSPAYTCVIGAKRYLAFLRAVWNNAHLCPAKIVVEQILEPHSLNTKDSPDILRILVFGFRFHSIVTI